MSILIALMIQVALDAGHEINESQIEETFSISVEDAYNVLQFEVALDSEAEGYTEQHVETMLKAFIGKPTMAPFVMGLSTNPAYAGMYDFLLVSGPDAIYGLLEMMSGANLIDKKRVKQTASITTTAAKRGPAAWYKQIYEDISVAGWEAMEAKFSDNLEDYRSRFPEIDSLSIVTFLDVLDACHKTTLNNRVAKLHVEKTGKDCAVAIGFRIDAHSPKKNGGWDPVKGEYTKDWHDKNKSPASE